MTSSNPQTGTPAIGSEPSPLPATGVVPPTRGQNRWFWCLVLAGVAIGVGCVVWREVIRDRVVVKRWGVVEPGRIFRSGQISPYLIRQVLENNRIGMVVDLTGDDPTNDGQPAERQAISELGIDLRKCQLIGDGTGDIRQYAAAVQAIVEAEAAGKPVLIHCSAGAQRTGGTIAAYRILVQGWQPEKAWQEMQDYGWDPSGDGVLVEYLNSHMRELAGLLVAADAISEVPDPLPQLPE